MFPTDCRDEAGWVGLKYIVAMDGADPALIEMREATKQAYLQLLEHHPLLPPTLKDFQVFLGKISWIGVCM